MIRFAFPSYIWPLLKKVSRNFQIFLFVCSYPLSAYHTSASPLILSDPSAEIEVLIQKSETAINKHDPAAMRPLADSLFNGSFDWVKSSLTPVWQVSLLKIPSSANSGQPSPYLAVFHAYHTCENDGDHIHQVTHTQEGWKFGKEILETDTCGFQIKNHDAAITFDLSGKTIHCTDKILIARNDLSKTRLLLMRISDDMRLSQLFTSAHDSSLMEYSQAGGVVAVVAPEQNILELTMVYSGKADHKQSDYIRDNELTLNSYWLPHIARLPASADITVSVPAGWIPIAQGDLILQKKNTDGSSTTTFHNQVPACCYTLDAGKYTITTRKSSGKTLSTYMLTPNAELSIRCLDILEKAMLYFEKTFEPYPYKSYSIVETQGAFPGALEAYSFATYGPRTLPGTIVHELAHTWWGGIVPCAYTRSMLDESLAEFSDSLYKQNESAIVPKHESLHHPLINQLRSEASTSHAFSGVSLLNAHETFDPFQSAVGYGKGSVVLELLDSLIGRDRMLRSLKSLVMHHNPYASIEWPDLEEKVHEVTGMDYRWFFEQWVERTGFPSVQLSNIRSIQIDGEMEINGELVQDGNPYRLTVPLTLQVLNGNLLKTVIEVKSKRTPFTFRTNLHPIKLQIDPDAAIPLFPTTPSHHGVSSLDYIFK